MLEGVKGTMSFWIIILKSRRTLGKSFFNKICYKYTLLNYLFNNLSSHMKNLIDNEAVRFGLERTSYVSNHTKPGSTCLSLLDLFLY